MEHAYRMIEDAKREWLMDALDMGHQTSNRMVYELLQEMGYSLQANRKTREGGSHPDRNEQFEHINAQVQEFQEKGQPVISVDTKKKELVGDFKNAGQEWRPKGDPEHVRVHDFVIPEPGKVAPYGVYDIGRNDAWVNVGTGLDTRRPLPSQVFRAGGIPWGKRRIRRRRSC